MSNQRVIIGPPGTGKTRRLLDLLADELRAGTPPERIAFVTFTRAARQEALDRVERDLGLVHEEIPWLRTIHSTAYRLLGLRPEQVMDAARWHEFAERYHYDLSEYRETEDDTPGEPPRRTKDDEWRYVIMWGRNRRIPLDRALARYGRFISGTQTEILLKRASDFKAERNLFDYADMLEQALIRGIRPEVDVAFVDEAQDLSPLQIAVVEMWFAPCRRVYVAGDDDQAIYAFQGAEPDWLLGLTERCETEILAQSHRVPGVVHGIAERIIRRNKRRVEKAYAPTVAPGEASVLHIHDALKTLDPTVDTFVLARNRMFLAPVARALYDRRVPYFVEGTGGVNPYGGESRVEAITAALALSRGQGIPVESLRAVLSFIPSRGVDLLPHGVKARADAATGVISPHVLREEFGLGTLLDRIAADGPTSILLKMRPTDREYFTGVIRRHGDVPAPMIRLTSIHAAKGREADHVIVLPDMTTSTLRAYRDHACGGNEAENRVAYVAVTRARRKLVMVRARSMRSFPYPAPARVEEVHA